MYGAFSGRRFWGAEAKVLGRRIPYSPERHSLAVNCLCIHLTMDTQWDDELQRSLVSKWWARRCEGIFAFVLRRVQADSACMTIYTLAYQAARIAAAPDVNIWNFLNLVL